MYLLHGGSGQGPQVPYRAHSSLFWYILHTESISVPKLHARIVEHLALTYFVTAKGLDTARRSVYTCCVGIVTSLSSPNIISCYKPGARRLALRQGQHAAPRVFANPRTETGTEGFRRAGLGVKLRSGSEGWAALPQCLQRLATGKLAQVNR